MEKVVIVGAGHGAGQVCVSLRQNGFEGAITMIGEETWYPYQRPPLSKKYLSGEMPAERLYFKPPSFYTDQEIDVLLGTRVSGIDLSAKAVSTGNGESLDWDHLVLATGSRPRRLEVDGSSLAGIHYLRGIDDVDGIRDSLAPGRRLAIIGAGYIGLEVAAVAARAGLKVTVIEMEDRVMSRVVTPELSRFYEEVHRGEGVRFEMSTGVKRFSGKRDVDGVVLDSGATVDVDAVVVGIGIVPNVELAASAGLEVSNGIVVDDHCRASSAGVYGIGDCTWHPNTLLGCELRLESVHNALEQAKTAAANICGKDTAYAQVPWFWSDQYDLKLQIAGLSRGYDEFVMRGEPESRSFSCLYLRDGRLISVDAVNCPKDFVQSKALIAAHAKIDPGILADTGIQLKDMV
jgi:3-phenylpropionate/trans-cinnamate dioxygenase ferredoxin reductase subunit